MRMSTFTEDEPATVFHFGEFRFDCASHLLLRNGEQQRLSPKAQQLLQMLLLNRPRAVSREEIYDSLWPATFVSETNMTGIVRELRHVLGDDARSSQYIRTVHGFGYAFVGDAETGDAARTTPAATLHCEGQRHVLYEGENPVGRARENRVVLTDETVSRCHAVVIIAGRTILIEDCGSTNGTYVNGKKIVRSTADWEDAIAFGRAQATIARVSLSDTLRVRDLHRRRRRGGGTTTPA
jgi:DNA-binding winged helix-turn-helix (wHTH) protein